MKCWPVWKYSVVSSLQSIHSCWCRHKLSATRLKNDKAINWVACAGSSRQSVYKRKLQLLEKIGDEGWSHASNRLHGTILFLMKNAPRRGLEKKDCTEPAIKFAEAARHAQKRPQAEDSWPWTCEVCILALAVHQWFQHAVLAPLNRLERSSRLQPVSPASVLSGATLSLHSARRFIYLFIFREKNRLAVIWAKLPTCWPSWSRIPSASDRLGPIFLVIGPRYS